MRYLLDAPDADMALWKQAAREEGLSFAAWARAAMTAALNEESQPPVKPNTSRTSRAAPPPPDKSGDSTGGKRTYAPDPKGRG